MAAVIDIRPYQSAVEQLRRSNRPDLRAVAFRLIRNEQIAGRNGHYVAREIRRARMAHGPRPEAR